MLRKILFAILLAPVFMASCKKEDRGPDNTFIINGVHDISFEGTGSTSLNLDIVQGTGAQESVTIAVSGLPSGVTAQVSPSSGTPAFSTYVSFQLSGNTAGGTYSVKITGTSASYSKSYDMKITVPDYGNFTINGTQYHVAYASRYSSTISFSTSDGRSISCATLASLPTADGTYTYTLTDYATSDNEMELVVAPTPSSSVYMLQGSSGKTATVKIVKGKAAISFATVRVYSYSYYGGGDYKDVSASVNE